VTSNVLYDDGKIVLDHEGVTLRRYYFPLGTSKRIWYGQIQQVRTQPMGWLTGKGRGWGSAHPGYWLPLDVSRPRKSTLIVLEVGGHVKPSFSPDDPEEVLQILRQRTDGAGSRRSAGSPISSSGVRWRQETTRLASATLTLSRSLTSPVDRARQALLMTLHRGLDEGTASSLKLGCVYVDGSQLVDLHALHPTWTHGSLVQRILSGVARAELVRHGYAVFGRSPLDVLPAMSDDDVRAAARAELTGYWTWAARRPWLWLDPIIADLGLTSMARGRHTLATGELLTKTRAVERAAAPAWLIDQLRARRRGEDITSPRLRTALIAWRDARLHFARPSPAHGTERSSAVDPRQDLAPTEHPPRSALPDLDASWDVAS